jgi:hypothetical protein
MAARILRSGLFIAAIALLHSTEGCKDTPSGAAQPNSLSVNFTIGDSFNYRWSLEERDSSRDSIWGRHQSDTGFAVVGAVNQKLGSWSGLMRMDTWSQEKKTVSSVWYSPAGDSLTEIAYYNPSSFLVLPKGAGAIGFPSGSFADAHWTAMPKSVRILMKHKGLADTSTRSDPRVVYKFPLKRGKQWQSFLSPFAQYRMVEQIVTLQAAGRFFTCAKIRTTLPGFAPAEFEWYDYIAEGGLILRTIRWNCVFTSDASPDFAGVTHVSERLELISTTK